jgi:hypothetical protein
MNKLVALIAMAIGGAFFAFEAIFPYGVSISVFGFSPEQMINPNHVKARAAVSALLFDPNSAEFDKLRDVAADGTQYVCGDVKAKDRGGAYSGRRAFVYEVRINIARIDDDEQIARAHAAYRPCPENLKPPASELDLEMAKKVLKVLPKVDPQALPTMASLPLGTKDPNGAPAATDLKTGLSQFRNTAAGRLTGSNGPSTQSDVPLVADLKNETEWRGDHPPAAWPTFPADDPLAKPAHKRTPEQAIALASNVEARWNSFKAGRSKSRPRTGEIEEALRALLTIEPGSKHFPKAWALFVGLRQIDREAVAMQSRPKASAGSAQPRG